MDHQVFPVVSFHVTVVALVLYLSRSLKEVMPAAGISWQPWTHRVQESFRWMFCLLKWKGVLAAAPSWPWRGAQCMSEAGCDSEK